MATLVSDGGDADRQRRAQRGVSRLLVRDLRKLRRLILPSRLQATVPDWIEAVRALVGEYGNASASLAADYYDAQRVAARVTGSFTVPLLDPTPDGQVDNSLRWATKDLWPRDPEDPATTEAQKAPLETRLEQAQRKAEAVAQKLVADQGRGTVRNAVQRDRQAVGYARAAALGACAFCKLMATRGMVFKSAASAGREANARFTGDASVVKFHDHCHCQVIPVYRGQRFQLSDKAKEWERLYREYAAPYSGDQLRRFRRAIEEHG
ncbi:VG15 protein [Streptomyces antimycoticus]